VLKGFVKTAVSPIYGSAQVVLNRKQPVRLEAVRDANKDDLTFAGNSLGNEDVPRDTVDLFYRKIKDTLRLRIFFPEQRRFDTIQVALPAFSKKRRVSFTSNLSSGKLSPGAPVRLNFRAWMDTVQTNSRFIHLSSKEDSDIVKTPLSLRWTSNHELIMSAALKEGLTYSLRLDTAAFTDMNGMVTDSSVAFFRSQPAAEFGNLRLQVVTLRKQAYLVELMNAQGIVVERATFTSALSSPSRERISFPRLAPGDYQVRVIFDNNANGRWDTGDVIGQRQPEQAHQHTKTIQVIADWETEEEVLLKTDERQ
jgi:hypothetical protein